ncbi:MAG: hypothetical protein LLF90_07890 [Methanomicrobiaceae archaeon]|uniref:hypothetical protein n=1 Tax=Methanoculleus sp. TaxID=90427 RepID=UPI00320F0949|nr:hypothetical protein [Methanomicrobiaceae archaeon]
MIERDHGSAYSHPDSPHACRAIRCLVDLQREMGGNALIGRDFSPLVTGAGCRDVSVSPRMVYADPAGPCSGVREGPTIITMVEDAGEDAMGREQEEQHSCDRPPTGSVLRMVREWGLPLYGSCTGPVAATCPGDC